MCDRLELLSVTGEEKFEKPILTISTSVKLIQPPQLLRYHAESLVPMFGIAR